jgi:hypothetical protein
MVSIDTEFSIGGYFGNPKDRPVDADRHIFCRIEGRDHGIGLIMDILEEHGIRGVFFLETEARHYFGEDIYRRIVAAVVSRGHEIQLHVHPVFRLFKDGATPARGADNFGHLSLQEQSDILGEGKRFLEACGAGPITAFRAGNFEAGPHTVQACAAAGIRFLSNQNLTSPGCRYLDGLPERNHPFELQPGIFEVPLTVFRESGGRKTWNGFQVCAASSRELCAASLDYAERGYGLIQFMTHSFELVKSADRQFRALTPNRLHIRRLREVCAFLADHPRLFQPSVFGDLASATGFDRADSEGYYVSPFRSVVGRYVENISGLGLAWRSTDSAVPNFHTPTGVEMAGLAAGLAQLLL